MRNKMIRKLLVCLAAVGMAAGICTVPVQASAEGYFVAGLSVDSGKLTNAQLEFYDKSGVIVGTCFADSVAVVDGSAEFPCDFTGYARSAELVSLTSDQLENAFAVVSTAKNTISIENLNVGKTGWFAVDLGGNLPTF